MPTLSRNTTHKPVKSYYAVLDPFIHLNITHEIADRAVFQAPLKHCARQACWILVFEYPLNPRRGRRTVIDGALIDHFPLAHGYTAGIGPPLPLKGPLPPRARLHPFYRF